MTILTPEMIEAGARALLVALSGPANGTRYDRYEAERILFTKLARACLLAALPGILESLLKEQKEYPYARAAFINAIAEEGTKAEAVEWLQKTWNELMHLRSAIRSLQTKENGGFLATLTPEQREKALSYRGPDGPIGQTKDNA